MYTKPNCVRTLSWISIGLHGLYTVIALTMALSGSDIIYSEEVSSSFKTFLTVMQMGSVPFIFTALWAAIGGSRQEHSIARMIIFVILIVAGHLSVFLNPILFRTLSVSEIGTMARLSSYMSFAQILRSLGSVALTAALSIDVYESRRSNGFGS